MSEGVAAPAIFMNLMIILGFSEGFQWTLHVHIKKSNDLLI